MMKKTCVLIAVLVAVMLGACEMPTDSTGSGNGNEALPAPPVWLETSGPVLTPGNGAITVRWGVIADAVSYNVYCGTNTTPPGNLVHTGITGTSATIIGLVNDIPYYVWVEAVNVSGTARSAAASVTLRFFPPAPVMVPSDRTLSVRWEAIVSAVSYNVYRSGTETPPETAEYPGITGTSVTFTGLTNNTAYYVWVEAVNAAETVRSAVVSGIPCPVWKVNSGPTFTEAVAAINAAGAGNYRITLSGQVAASNVAFTHTGVPQTITIAGDETPREIANTGESVLFTVNADKTLVLENNISLDGSGKAYNVVSVEGGTLIMKAGSDIRNAKASGVSVAGGVFTMEGGKISGNTARAYSSSRSYSYGGGVYVGGGAFTMKGGEISGNRASVTTTSSGNAIIVYSYGGGVYVGGGTFAMEGGEISGNTAITSFAAVNRSVASVSFGGGVYVGGGAFTMEGGEISWNTAYAYASVSNSSPYSFSYGGGVSGRFTKKGGGIIDATNSATRGKVAYAGESRQRNTTAGPNVDLDSGVDGSAGGWEP